MFKELIDHVFGLFTLIQNKTMTDGRLPDYWRNCPKIFLEKKKIDQLIQFEKDLRFISEKTFSAWEILRYS